MDRRSTADLPSTDPAGQKLAQAAGLGPKSADMLAAAGIDSMQTLRHLGSVTAYIKVRQTNPRASLNLLWALEGAISGLHWQQVACEHRTSLLLALEQLQSQARRGKGPAR